MASILPLPRPFRPEPIAAWVAPQVDALDGL